MKKTLFAGLATLTLLSTALVTSASAENRHGMMPSRQMMHHRVISKRHMIMKRHQIIKHHMHRKM